MICKGCSVDKPESSFRQGRSMCYRCVYLRGRKKKNATRRISTDQVSVRSKAQERASRYHKKRREKGLEKAYRESSVRRWLCGRTRTSKVAAKRKDKIYSVSLDFLCALYERQFGRCAISDLPMTTKFHSPYAISIDRVDSDEGYTEGNVQLVCQAINLAKARHDNSVMVEFVNSIKEAGRNDRTAGREVKAGPGAE